MKLLLIIAAVIFSMSLSAQEDDKIHCIEPIESKTLQGIRKATKEEIEYAKILAKEEIEQEQINNNLPFIDQNGQTITTPYWYNTPFGFFYLQPTIWELHKGLNVNISTSVFAISGNGLKAGITQDVSAMYVKNISKKGTLAIGGYFNNMNFASSNYTSAGFNATFGYKFDDHWSAYAFVQKAFASDNVTPWAITYGTHGNSLCYNNTFDFMPIYPCYVSNFEIPYNFNRFMDRIGAGVTYQWGKYNQNSINIQIEYNQFPQQRNKIYNHQRYSFPSQQ